MFDKCKAFVVLVAAVILVFSTAPAVDSHARNQSYLYFDVTDGSLSGRLEVTFSDLSKVLAVDVDDDGTVTEAEIQERKDAIYEYFFSDRLILEHGDEQLELVPTRIEFLDVVWDTFALMHFDVEGLARVPDEITINYRFLWDDLEPYHLGFALLASNTRTELEENEANFSLAFLSGAERQTLSLIAAPWHTLSWHYMTAGFGHVWNGVEHILLSIVLGVAALVRRDDGAGLVLRDLKSGVLTGLSVVFAFIVAHGVASFLAVHGFLRIPPQLTLGLSTAGVSVVAATMVFPNLLKWLLAIALLFGFIHGLSYAHTIGPVDIEPNRKLLSAVGFTLGTGVVMAAVTIMALIVAFAALRYVFFRAGLLRFTAAGVAVLALVWAEERVFDLLGDLGPTILASIGL